MIQFEHPESLPDKLGGLEILPQAAGESQIKEIVEKVVQYSAKTCSPYFYNQVTIILIKQELNFKKIIKFD